MTESTTDAGALTHTLSPVLSVVAPVFRNSATLAELARRAGAVAKDLGVTHELVLVDDASPDGAAKVIGDLAAREPSIRGIVLAENVGQYRAVWTGLRHTRGEWVVVLDADLQDPPEAIPALLERARDGYQAVFAGRSGQYQSAHRMLTSRFYKMVQRLVCGVPHDAGMYMVLQRPGVDRLLALPGAEGLSPVVLVGLAGLSWCSVPVLRAPRPVGSSAYSNWQRIRLGMRNLAGAARQRWWPGGRRDRGMVPVRVVRQIGFQFDGGVGGEPR